MAARFLTQRYSRQALWTLFLACAFPIHLWTLILAFRDISWVAARTNMWDAVGVVSYGLLFALVESVFIFLLLAALGLLLPAAWDTNRRIAFLVLLFFLVSVWAVIGQLLMIWGVPLPAPMNELIRGSSRPLRILYAIALVLVIPTILLPVYLFLKSKQAVPLTQNLLERISLLTTFYLVMDLLALLVVLARNVS